MNKLASISRTLSFVSCCGLVFAQTALIDLEQTAAKTQAQWYGLASVLDTRLTRMLPCDAGAITTIEETHKASTARMAAVSAYTKALADQAAQDVAIASQIQRTEVDYSMSLSAERTDTEQERAGAETQMRNLAESVRKRVSLTAASDELQALEALVRERANLVGANATATEAVLPRYASLVQALEKREAALRKQVSALEEERTKWNGYYAARLARARVECSSSGMGR